MENMTRRRLLRMGSTATLAGIAGCGNITHNETPRYEDTAENNTDNETSENEENDETNNKVSLRINDDYPQELRVENNTDNFYEVIPTVIEVSPVPTGRHHQMNIFNLEPGESRAIYVEADDTGEYSLKNPRILQPPIGQEIQYDGNSVIKSPLWNATNNIIPPENSEFTSTDGIQANATNSTGIFQISSDKYTISDPVEVRAHQTPPGTNRWEINKSGDIVLDTGVGIYWVNDFDIEVLSATSSEEITASVPEPDVTIELIDTTVEESWLESIKLRASANNEYYVPEARIIGVFNKFIKENTSSNYFPLIGKTWTAHSSRPQRVGTFSDATGYHRTDIKNQGDIYVGFVEEIVPHKIHAGEADDLQDRQLISGSPKDRIETNEEYTLDYGSLYKFDLPIENDLDLTLYLQSGPTILDKTSVNVADELF
jgi:hypothetical protein